MDSYQALAPYYDRFTDDVPYDQWADFVERLFTLDGQRPEIVLDLACGTGAMTRRLAQKGYDLIGVDASEEMLMQARERAAGLNPPPLFLQQEMEELDLYGTVGACVCCLDSVNYLTELDQLQRAFDRVALFLEPGGLFLFDVNTPYKHREILGNHTFVYDTDEVYCVWQNTALPDDTVQMDLDFFFPDEAQEDVYVREREQITERAYAAAQWEEMLRNAGFRILTRYDGYTENPPSAHSERIVYAVQKE